MASAVGFSSDQQKIASTASPTKKWLHNNPEVQKIASFALMFLGVVMADNELNNNQARPLSLYSILPLAGALLLVAASLALHKFMPFFIPPTFNPAERAFKEQSIRCGAVCREGTSSVYAEKMITLKYVGNLPVFTVPKGVSHYNAGCAKGYMMAEQIRHLISQNDFAFHTLKGLPRDISNIIEKMNTVIPKNSFLEMEGIACGYNKKRREWQFFKGKELTLEQLIYFHLLPEICHLNFGKENKQLEEEEEIVGCTVVVNGKSDRENRITPHAIRTVDWLANLYGKYSFVEERVTENGVRYVGQSLPLFVGCLTAMNEYGLCVAMNVARGEESYLDRLPAVFYLKELIDCHSVSGKGGAEAFWQEHLPMGPFNLSVLDEHDAAGVHFYQLEKGTKTNVRWWRLDQELVTLNYRYEEQGETNPTPTNSAQRKAEINEYFAKRRVTSTEHPELNRGITLKGILKGDEVNNIRTITAAYMDPKTRRFQIAFDNGYAGDRPLLDVPTASWFARS